MKKGGSEENEVHVVMLPWLAFGHMIPYLDLSIALAKFGIHVSFISTPRNISRLPKIPPNLSQFIEFVALPLPKLESDPLPENAEATTDIPLERMDDLMIACDLLREPVKKVIAEKSPNWILVDFFYHWAADIALELDVPLILYIVVSAASAVFFEGQRQASTSPQDMTVPPDHETEASTPGMEAAARVIRITQGCKAIVVRTCPELEADYLKSFSKMTGRPVIPMGCLPPETVEEASVNGEEPWSGVFGWLDKQKPKSVAFIGFGSECKLQREDIHEIAYGIELSGLPFIFILAKPLWGGGDDDEVVPPGFESRTAGRGVVQIGWAPQREILAHPSIGGSLFHAGWGSIMENLRHGNYLVLLPFIFTQPLETRLLVDKGLAIEVERAEDGSFTRNGIANALQKAMVAQEGEALRARTKEAAHGIFANKQLNHTYFNKFVEYLKDGVYENK
ncbi:putative UDP-rhamnose:rhamnosyltransferase 1 [Salvia miltiorrhiza]|uniref:putative UDP-rhamnose:rhamnosyltransferase 1 n=1 Tax=Salvia miltiorrhiza TaxID=226208 RepID=UPI0025AD4DCA|nr:putative UDP-rhamnose:rhamnosyltransferase 1 [Salvia miltiorrhiza]